MNFIQNAKSFCHLALGINMVEQHRAQQNELPQELTANTNGDQFFKYYAEASKTEETRERFLRLRDMLLRVMKQQSLPVGNAEVADIGCGAGTQAFLWAELGFRIFGVDSNQALIQLAQRRAAEIGFDVDFSAGTAEDLPWTDKSMDVCLAIELLEHVPKWQECLKEFDRVLKPGGILCVTTTNKLCPVQHEFKLPLYSWYPAPIKRYYERIATSKRPELVNHAKFPAVNWFSYFSLRKALRALGFETLDRFDVNNTQNRKGLPRYVLLAIQNIPFLRWLAHVFVQGTLVVAIKGKTHHVQKID